MVQDLSARHPAWKNTLIANSLALVWVSCISEKESKFLFSQMKTLFQVNICSVSAWFLRNIELLMWNTQLSAKADCHYHSEGFRVHIVWRSGHGSGTSLAWFPCGSCSAEWRNVMQILSQRCPPMQASGSATAAGLLSMLEQLQKLYTTLCSEWRR